MSTKQELRAIIDDLRDRLHVLRTERNALRDELSAARSERDAALAALTELRQADEPTTPTPRAFRVGDRVRVAEGATCKNLSGYAIGTNAGGAEGKVRRIEPDGDLFVCANGRPGSYVSPEFCTLIEPEPEPDPAPAPSVRVRVVYESGGLSQDFDADGIAVMEAAPVYALLKDGAVVACVPVAGVRSVEVVR